MPPNKKSSAPDGDEDTEKKAVLDLLDDGGKPTRGQRRKQQLAVEEKKRSSFEDAKKNALNLFEEGDKPKKKAVRRKDTASTGLPAIAPQDEVHTHHADPLAEALKAGGGSVEALVKNFAKAAKHKAEEAHDAPGSPAAESSEPGQAGGSSGAPADAPVEGDPDAKKLVSFKQPLTVKELAERLDLRPFQVIKHLMDMEVFANAATVVDTDVAAKIGEMHGFIVERERREKGGGFHAPTQPVVEPPPVIEEPEEQLKPRAPIITFMGHVDHGKTSLLDAIRQARVAAGEAGGITQHIGAYLVEHNGTPITFLDTPGHAIFTQMRARGAQATDIVVLVVAADDGFMPQTDEALNHARAAGVTIMVAINKCDLPAANIDRVYSQLQERDLSPEAWGGNTIAIPVSAYTKQGINELLDMMVLQAEVMELKANPKATARAAVIEARLEIGRGSTATVIVQSGTLKVGMPFICGPFSGKVRTLVNDRGQSVKSAGPGTPVEIVGFSGLPNVGDEVVEMKSEKDAKRLSDERQEELRQDKLQAPQRARLENLFANMEAGNKVKTLKVILKGDVQGSVEAIAGALGDIQSEKVKLEIIHSAAGPISESDVLLGSASDAILLGFNVKLESNAVKVAKREGVQVKLYSIVYELIDQIEEAMLGMLDPETRESHLGQAKVLQVFKAKRGKAAGCYVQEGRIERKARARVLRDGQVVFDGPIGTLRRFQDDVDEVKAGTECGIRLGDYNDYETNDIIECYQLEKIAQSL
ncbi:MAG: translation initiation factor IF-2 [Verrucomicrobiales bacterium]